MSYIIIGFVMLLLIFWFAFWYFRAKGFLLILTGAMCTFAVLAQSVGMLAIGGLCFILYILSFCLSGKNNYSDNYVMDSTKKLNQKEKQIEKEYGIIDFTEK